MRCHPRGNPAKSSSVCKIHCTPHLDEQRLHVGGILHAEKLCFCLWADHGSGDAWVASSLCNAMHDGTGFQGLIRKCELGQLEPEAFSTTVHHVSGPWHFGCRWLCKSQCQLVFRGTLLNAQYPRSSSGSRRRCCGRAILVAVADCPHAQNWNSLTRRCKKGVCCLSQLTTNEYEKAGGGFHMIVKLALYLCCNYGILMCKIKSQCCFHEHPLK